MSSHTFEIHALLRSLGAQESNTGFSYTVCAAELCRQEPTLLLAMTKALYPAVGDICQVNGGAVERGIRRTVDEIWNSHPADLERLAGHSLRRKPTNAQFLGILCADFI